ncbi:MAG: hypothetical protein ACRDOO_15150 [Actinomadura sp.]
MPVDIARTDGAPPVRHASLTVMVINAPPRPAGRRSRLALVIALAVVAGAGGCGSAAWYLGLFTSDGRFDRLDPCTLLPPPRLAPLVRDGAREPGDSRPRTLFGFGSGDASSECKWSSVPAGQDRPFRTVRIHTETKIRDGRISAETRADRALALWYGNAARRGAPPSPVDVGEQGYRNTDTMEFQILFSRTVVYDLHVKFRISNALVDVSARTHTTPTGQDMARVLGLAQTVAAGLG